MPSSTEQTHTFVDCNQLARNTYTLVPQPELMFGEGIQAKKSPSDTSSLWDLRVTPGRQVCFA